MNTNHQVPQQIKIPFGEFPRIKCKECGGGMMRPANLFHWWEIPNLLTYKFGNRKHLCEQLYKCAECGCISDEIGNPILPQGMTTEEIGVVTCSDSECGCREFTTLNIIYLIPQTYRAMLNGTSRLSVEYMLCAECGAHKNEINVYPLPEGVKWEPKK